MGKFPDLRTRSPDGIYGLHRILIFGRRYQTNRTTSPRRFIHASTDSTDGCCSLLRYMGRRAGCGFDQQHRPDSARFADQHYNNSDHDHHEFAKFFAIDNVSFEFNDIFNDIGN